MILHKLIGSAEAGKYLPFALSRLKALNAVHGDGGYFSHRWVIDGIEINVQQSPPAQYVRLTGLPTTPAYEFVASDWLDSFWYCSPDYYPSVEYPVGAIQAHGMRVTFNEKPAVASETTPSEVTPKTTPIYSTSLTPHDGQSWYVRDIHQPVTPIRENFFKCWPWWQSVYMHEKQWFYDNRPDVVLATAYGTSRPTATSVGLGDFFLSAVIGPHVTVYDGGYDLMPTVMRAGQGVTEGVVGPYLGPEAWPRAGAMQVVEGRKFFILGDNKGRIHVYPAKAYFRDEDVLAAYGPNPPDISSGPSTGSTLIKPKTVTPTYPAWVSLPDPDARDVLLWWNWRFNKDATKAATVALKQEARPGWFFYSDPSVYDRSLVWTWRAFPESDFGASYEPDHPRFSTSKKGPQAIAYTPGLLEITIAIKITGPNDDDFDVTVEVVRSEHFYEYGRYFVDVGYLYDDKRLFDPNDLDGDGKPKQMPEGTLMGASLDLYYNSDYETGWYMNKVGATTKYTDPSAFDPGIHMLACTHDAAYVVSRLDTDADVMRLTLTRNRHVLPLPAEGLADTPYGPSGFDAPAPTVREIYPIWQVREYIDQYLDFFNHGPSSVRAPYYRTLLNTADLSSLSFGFESLETLYPTYTHDTYWHPTSMIKRNRIVLIGFGEQKLYKIIDEYRVPPWGTSYAGVFDHKEPVDGAPIIGEIAVGKRVALPAHLHTSALYNGVALDMLNSGAYKVLSPHPKGHLIATVGEGNIGGQPGTDYQSVWNVVSLKMRDGKFYDGDVKDYFNDAFDQEREYTYYAQGVTEGPEAGSFNICGYWLPYREAA